MCMYVCVYVHVYVCMYMCMYVCMYMCMYVCMYVLYIDFAVSAPYEGSGVVYIYHGQEMVVNGTIVNTQYQQVRIHVLVNN